MSDIDFQELAGRFDLLALVEADLGPAKKSGRWILFHCPFPGHAHGDSNPSLSVTPDNGRYFCFTCRQTGDSLTWLTDYRKLGWKQIFDLADSGSLPAAQPRPVMPAPAPAGPPCATWQERGRAFVQYCEGQLWGDPGRSQKVFKAGGELLSPLDYLYWRGLRDDTIKAHRLGYNPRGLHDKPESWGLPADPDSKGLWLDRGITIPAFVGVDLWAVNVRRLNSEPKYRKVAGSKPALFGADSLRGADLVLLTEGEFDCILAAQELGDVAGVATLGSASKGLDLATWGVYLLPAEAVLLAYDLDSAGKSGLAKLGGMSARFHPVTVPALHVGDKDLTDYHQAGGDLWAWLSYNLQRLGLLGGLDAPGFPWPAGANFITVRWSADSRIPVIADSWLRLPDGRIEAAYTHDEFMACLAAAQGLGSLPEREAGGVLILPTLAGAAI